MKRQVIMTEGNPGKLLISFAIPILIGSLFQQIYSLADRIIVGQFVGASAFAAVGSTNALSMMFMSMCMGSAIGTGVVVAQYFGAKDERNTAKAIANSTWVNGLIAVVMTVLALLLSEPLLRLLNTPESLMADAVLYLKIYMGGLIAVAAFWTPFSILRALGDSTTPLIFLIICSLLNIVLDLIFVVPLHMGVAGAAIATVLSQAIAAAMCIIYSLKKVPVFRLSLKYLKPDRNMIRKIVGVGIPTGLQYSFMYISTIVLQRVVNGFGETTIAAFTATSQIELLVQSIYTAIGNAMVTYTGQNIGAGKTDRVDLGMKAAMRICLVISLILLAILWIFGRPIMGMFVNDKDITELAASGIRITSLFFMAFGAIQVLRYLLNGAGDSGFALINGVIEVVARIGFAYLLTSIPLIGRWGIWLTTGLTWLTTALFAFGRYKGGKWKSKSLVQESNTAAATQKGNAAL